jgi:hypothetical protein
LVTVDAVHVRARLVHDVVVGVQVRQRHAGSQRHPVQRREHLVVPCARVSAAGLVGIKRVAGAVQQIPRAPEAHPGRAALVRVYKAPLRGAERGRAGTLTARRQPGVVRRAAAEAVAGVIAQRLTYFTWPVNSVARLAVITTADEGPRRGCKARARYVFSDHGARRGREQQGRERDAEGGGARRGHRAPRAGGDMQIQAAPLGRALACCLLCAQEEVAARGKPSVLFMRVALATPKNKHTSSRTTRKVALCSKVGERPRPARPAPK